ncbi:uncharacterized protein LOC129759977 [Uranotaenia lowii]|uniref:uncharacterized protein LOC129759977 n=1 Tax=Uranotaenia lowii TaxID=190385 RepID=UPI00247AC71A|nr:uncharacterized protein LOC129759977 [Uranotaenia lowii]
MGCEVYRSGFLKDLLLDREVDVYEQLLLFGQSPHLFWERVDRLEKSALDALVRLLILWNKQREPAQIDLRRFFRLVEDNYLYLQKDETCLGLLINVLGLSCFLETDNEKCLSVIEECTTRLCSEYQEVPVFYDILRILLTVSMDKPVLASVWKKLDKIFLMKNLFSESHSLKIKSLVCVQLLMNFCPEITEDWFQTILTGKEHRIAPAFLSFALCHFIDSMTLLQDSKDSFIKVISNESMWDLLYENIKNDDRLIRKESLSVIKKLVSYLNEKSFKETIQQKLFQWNSEESRCITEAWQCFITIVETLNESQTHLVLPALPLITKLNCLANEWKNCVLFLMLKHENNAVSDWTLNHILTQSSYSAKRPELEMAVLETLNHTTVFQDSKKIKSLLTQYYATAEATTFLLKSIKKINWASVPFKSLLDVLTKLFENDNEVQCLDETIRDLHNACNMIKNRCLRILASHALCELLLKLISRNGNRRSISLVTALLTLDNLCAVTNVELNKWQQWPLVFQLINETDFREILKMIQPSNCNIIKCILVPKMTKDLFIEILSDNPQLAIEFYSCADRDLKEEIYYILLQFSEQSIDIIHRSQETAKVIQRIQLLEKLFDNKNSKSIYQKIEEKLIVALEARMDQFDYNTESIAITIFLNRLCRSSDGANNCFFETFSLDQLINSIQSQKIAKTYLEEIFLSLSEIYHDRLFRKKTYLFGTDYNIIQANYDKLIDRGDHRVLLNTIRITAHLAKMQDSDDEVDRLKKITDRCYKEIMVYRKSEHFPSLMSTFIEALFAPYANSTYDPDCNSTEWLGQVVNDYCQLILDQAVAIPDMAVALFSNMLQLPSCELLLEWATFGKILLAGLLFGEGQKKEQRIEDECCMSSEFYESSLLSLPELQQESRVRLLCAMFLYKLSATNHPDAMLFLLKLERMLMEKFQQISKTKERYYANSATHRSKLRIVQALCILLKLTGTKPYPLLEVVLYETNQPNINYLIELILADSPIDILTMINALKSDRVKVSGVESLFVIVWLRSCKVNYLDESFISFLLPWTMAQNFSIRLYAQITISKLLEKFVLNPEDHFVYKAINSYLRQGNVERNLEKYMKDFRFNSLFDYQNLLTLENIYNNIPRVSEMATEDVVSSRALEDCLKRMGLSGHVNLGQALVFEQIASERKESLFLSQGFSSSDYIQKKIVPLKSIEPSLDTLTSLPQQLRLKKIENTDGLIIIASLVDRPPNLGGLARSSEIFAVKQYIINSLKDLDNKEFQALSMTAEKWLNVAELKSFQIVDYLLAMKMKGYSIVGAEQTTGSRPIQQIKFPKRSILVLGHEKEGLPAHIISHLDIIAEIPQFGVVRSLNVHVTGAIFMWEYAKQHHLTECC